MTHKDTPEQATIRASRGFICNYTGGHCPRGCRAPCGYEIHSPEGIARRDYNSTYQKKLERDRNIADALATSSSLL